MTRPTNGTGGVTTLRARLMLPETAGSAIREILTAYEESWAPHDGRAGPCEGYSLRRTADTLGVGHRTLNRLIEEFKDLREACSAAREIRRSVP